MEARREHFAQTTRRRHTHDDFNSESRILQKEVT